MDKSIQPTFVIGINRSGTTLLSLMLNAHSKIAVPYESKFITELFKSGLGERDFIDEKEKLKVIKRVLCGKYVSAWDKKIYIDDLNLKKCTSLASTAREVYEVYTRKAGKKLWVDKDPSYADDVYILNKLFPDARYIFLVRDGRDVALSLVEQYWGPNDYVSCLEAWAKMVVSSWKQVRMLDDSKYVELRYEDLVTNPKKELKKICTLLDVSYEEEMISEFGKGIIEKVGDMRAAKHHSKLSEKLNPDELFKWKNKLNKIDIALSSEIAGAELNEFGYEVPSARNIFKPIRRIHYWINEKLSARSN